MQTFNNPLTTFKTESFIVLMTIAWIYLLHAYYRREGVEYRYHKKGPKKRKFHRSKSGAFRYWSLEDCLNESTCPLDEPIKLNLRFLIGLRHEIEHHRAVGADKRFAGRYLACCLNYERYICDLFDGRYSIGDAAAFTLQFRDLADAPSPRSAVIPLPSNVDTYFQQFDAGLSIEELNSPYFRRRFLFVPIVTNKKAQADEVIEFVRADSDLGRLVNENYQQVILKEVERPKHLPGQIVKLIEEEGYPGFKTHHHTQLWKKLDAKNPGKGFGVMIAEKWYWYDQWVDEVRKHCADKWEAYAADPKQAA